MKYHQLYRINITGFDLSAIESLLEAIKSRFSGKFSFYPEVEFSDSTKKPFKLGKLESLLNENTNKGLEPIEIELTAIKMFSAGRRRVVQAHFNKQYSTLQFSVGSDGRQDDIDWAKASFDALKLQADSNFKKVKSTPQNTRSRVSVNRSDKKTNIDWKWWVGIAIASLGVIGTWLSLR